MFNEITSYIDLAQVTLYAFWIFFAGLVYWLRQEDRREGYPLESDAPIRIGDQASFLIPAPKLFFRPDGSEYRAPSFERDERAIEAERTSPAAGSPIEPRGNPMLSGVGPASYAERHDEPELTREGHHAVVPLRAAPEYSVSAGPDPRGWDVMAADGAIAGRVKEIWIDRAELLVRYLEVELTAGAPAPSETAPKAKAKDAKKSETEKAEDGKKSKAGKAKGEADEEVAAEAGDEADEDEAAKTTAAKTEAAKTEAAKTEAAKTEDAKTEDDEDAAKEADASDGDEESSEAGAGDDEDEGADDEDQAVAATPSQASTGSGATRLLPITMAVVLPATRTVAVSSIEGAQFGDVPQTAAPDSITVMEEERVQAYFAGGLLYADPSRLEPFV